MRRRASPASVPATTCRPRARTDLPHPRGARRMGGTWDLFRYPGIRSDSDMYTLGYSFRPWTSPKAIADGPVDPRILAGHGARVRCRPQDPLRPPRATRLWSSRDARWTVNGASDTEQREVVSPVASSSCAAATTTTPRVTRRNSPARNASAGASCIRRNGPMTSTTHGKRVVVIGSGATAVTLVPELARQPRTSRCSSVRRPTSSSRPAEDALANWLRRRCLTGGRVRDRPLEKRADQRGVFLVLPPAHRSVPRRCSCAA